MAGYDSNVVLNIVPLFNTATPDGNADVLTQVQTAVIQLQTMIDTANHIVKADTIQPYSSNAVTIQNLNVSGSLFYQGQLVNLSSIVIR
jgi:hypothetical protein